jgi:hypothetical protein
MTRIERTENNPNMEIRVLPKEPGNPEQPGKNDARLSDPTGDRYLSDRSAEKKEQEQELINTRKINEKPARAKEVSNAGAGTAPLPGNLNPSVLPDPNRSIKSIHPENRDRAAVMADPNSPKKESRPAVLPFLFQTKAIPEANAVDSGRIKNSKHFPATDFLNPADKEDPGPGIRVSIGRIDIYTDSTVPAQPNIPRARSKPKLSLEDFLKQRNKLKG